MKHGIKALLKNNCAVLEGYVIQRTLKGRDNTRVRVDRTQRETLPYNLWGLVAPGPRMCVKA